MTRQSLIIPTEIRSSLVQSPQYKMGFATATGSSRKMNRRRKQSDTMIPNKVSFTAIPLLMLVLLDFASGQTLPPFFSVPTSPTPPPVPAPTPAPVPPPTTSAPVTAPTTPAPVTAPTPPPIIYITPSPVPLPTTRAPTFPAPTTPLPTLRPTKRPTTLSPTKRPTASPTEQPTPVPTEQPTTRSPTLAPTNSPTTSPTLTPTVSPSSVPTRITSAAPTLRPSDSPSESPTFVPTPSPTTATPTQAPTQSAQPTTVTRSPTISAMPSVSPSITPTLMPTTAVPSKSPSWNPTDKSSTVPTNMPTLEPQEDISAVVMLLSEVTVTNRQLTTKAVFDFEAMTKDHIEQTIDGIAFGDDPVIGLTINVRIDNQRVVTTRRRRLQNVVEIVSLQVAFNVLFSFQSTKEYDASEWVEEAFNSPNNRASFMDRLRQRNSDFRPLRDMRVQVDNEIIEDEDDDNSNGITDPVTGGGNGEKDNTVWVIVGACAGGFVVLVAAALILIRRNDRNKQDAHQAFVNQTQTVDQTSVDNTKTLGYAAEINVDRQDDISTLGDPVYGGHIGGMLIGNQGMMENRDEHTASIGPDYDYTKHFYGTDASMGTNTLNNDLTSTDESNRERLTSGGTSTSFKKGLGPMGASVFSDDASFEEQFNPALTGSSSANQKRFEVEVPPGKLGMVIDTPGNGVPVVHAIKQESILCDRVRVGDRLISVDGEDVTQMTAVQVSKLISLKSDQQRLLVFVRIQDINPSDDDSAGLDS